MEENLTKPAVIPETLSNHCDTERVCVLNHMRHCAPVLKIVAA